MRALALALALVLLVLAANWSPTVARTREADVDDLTTYRMVVEFDADAATIAGTMTIDWRNATDTPQDVVYLRLFPNAFYYGEGDLSLQAAAIDGSPVEPDIDDDPTTAGLPMPEPVAAGDHATIELAFTTTVPEIRDASFGVFGGDPEDGWALADWHPIVAGWEDGAWYLAPPTQFGDPTFAEAARYEAEVTTPDDLVVVASGRTVAGDLDRQGDRRTVEIVSAPGRDFTMTLLPDTARAPVATAALRIGEVDVRVTAPDDDVVPGLTDQLLDVAAASLPLYGEWLGSYEDTELDIVLSPLSGASGIAWNGVIWLDVRTLVEDGELDAQESMHLQFVLTHEIGHQWIAQIIGSNNNDHGFMTEGLVNHLALLVLGEQVGAEGAEDFLYGWVVGSYVGLVRDGRDGIADAPITDDTNVVIRSFLIYGKAAVGFEAIRQEIGDEAYLEGLAAYAATFRFAVSGPDDLEAAFSRASGDDLGELWSFWFDQDATTIADLEAVLGAFRPLA